MGETEIASGTEVIVRVAPTEREAKLVDKIGVMVEQAERAEVKDIESAEKAADLAKWFRVLIKKIDEERTILVKPLNDHVKMINGRFKNSVVRLEAGQATIDRKILAFKVEEEKRLKAEAAERRRLEEEAAIKRAEELEAAGKGTEANAVIENAAAAPAPVAKVGTMRGSYGAVATVRQVWTFEIDDISKVPADYLEVKSSAVNQAIRDGVREIPGLRIYQKDSMTVR